MTHALALGCSHTAAVGIDPELGYVELLSKKFNIKIINLAVPGGNSSMVEKALIDHVQNHSPKFILAQWPNPFRRTIWVNNQCHNENVHNAGALFKSLLYADENNFMQPWLQSIVTCNALCRFANIPIINILFEDIDTVYHDFLSQYNIKLHSNKNLPDEEWWFDSAAEDKLHHSAHCHQQWAKRLTNIINKITMKLPQEKFCVLPWISLEASPIGTVRPCCLADDELVDNNGEKFSLISADFSDIQNSDSMRQLRKQFLAGEQPQTCRKCWNEEQAGRTSKRMHTLDRLKHMLPDQEWTEHSKPLMFLDLKLGNICNLKCRICGSWSSSQFAAEEIAWTPREEQKKTYAYQMLRAGSWPRENTQFWSQVDSVLEDIRYIEFTGGEPFMIQEHFAMLQGIVDRGIAHQVEIHYNTNGTHYPEAAPEIWRHFKTVEIALSIDDVAERFEYQRTNAVWTDVLKNVARFRQLKTELPNIRLQCCTTVNVFNVRYLKHVASWIEHQGFDFVYWNIMHDAWFFSIASLPDTAKLAVTAYLNNCNPPAKFREEFAKIRDFMNNGASTDGDTTRVRIADLDRKRDQDFAKVCPEMAEIIKYVKT